MDSSERATYRLAYSRAAEVAHTADPTGDGLWRKRADSPAILGPVLAEVVRRMGDEHREPLDLVLVRDAVTDTLVQRPPRW
jgi:hypothetical protein